MSEMQDEIREANRFARDHNAAWKDEQRETAERIERDVEAIRAFAYERALALANAGLLDLENYHIAYSDTTHRHERTRIADFTPEQVAKRIASIIEDNLLDALSKKALEARDVAGGAHG